MRYHFDMIGRMSLQDRTGVDLTDDLAAMLEAKARARHHWQTQLLTRTINFGSVRVRDETDRLVAVVPVDAS